MIKHTEHAAAYAFMALSLLPQAVLFLLVDTPTDVAASSKLAGVFVFMLNTFALCAVAIVLLAAFSSEYPRTKVGLAMLNVQGLLKVNLCCFVLFVLVALITASVHKQWELFMSSAGALAPVQAAFFLALGLQQFILFVGCRRIPI